MKRMLMCLVLLSAGCVFSGEKDSLGDTGGENNQNNETDMTTLDMPAPDASANNGMPDMDGAPDLGMPEEGAPDLAMPDMAMPDMEPDMPPGPMPYVLAADHTISLGGTPSTQAPTEVAELATGFLIGYGDNLAERAIFGWYSSDSATVLDSAIYPSDQLELDVVTTATGGFGVFQGSDDLFVVWFEPSVVGAPALNPTLRSTTATSTTKREMVAAAEGDTAYTLHNPVFTSSGAPRLNVGIVDDTGWGFAPTASLLSFDLRQIEVVGGEGGVGRRLLGAGSMPGTYRLNDYLFDLNVSPEWMVDQFECGNAPNDPRIVPFRDHWALIEAPDAAGSRLDAVECVTLGDSVANRVTLVTPNDRIRDFDIAKEDLISGAEFAVAWVDGNVPMFGEVFADIANGTVTLQRSMALPGTADRVRAAYNPMRDQWAVVVTSANVGSRLFILETNPNF